MDWWLIVMAYLFVYFALGHIVVFLASARWERGVILDHAVGVLLWLPCIIYVTVEVVYEGVVRHQRPTNPKTDWVNDGMTVYEGVRPNPKTDWVDDDVWMARVMSRTAANKAITRYGHRPRVMGVVRKPRVRKG